MANIAGRAHALAKKQMKCFGGMVTFTLKDASFDQVKTFLSALKITTLAESLGGVEGLIEAPATMTHAAVPEEQRKKLGITEGFLRFSVGIEDTKDVLADLKQALDKVFPQ